MKILAGMELSLTERWESVAVRYSGAASSGGYTCKWPE